VPYHNPYLARVDKSVEGWHHAIDDTWMHEDALLFGNAVETDTHYIMIWDSGQRRDAFCSQYMATSGSEIEVSDDRIFDDPKDHTPWTKERILESIKDNKWSIFSD
jgi:hypothetical protein